MYSINSSCTRAKNSVATSLFFNNLKPLCCKLNRHRGWNRGERMARKKAIGVSIKRIYCTRTRANLRGRARRNFHAGISDQRISCFQSAWPPKKRDEENPLDKQKENSGFFLLVSVLSYPIPIVIFLFFVSSLTRRTSFLLFFFSFFLSFG